MWVPRQLGKLMLASAIWIINAGRLSYEDATKMADKNYFLGLLILLGIFVLLANS